jgi:hypothetical protein
MTMRGRSARPRLGACVVALVTVLGVLPGIGLTAPGRPLWTDAASEHHGDAEHVYRIVGKVRFLLFWASADDVGGARITWRGRKRDQAVSLLIGSEPARAPREVNQWGYIREDVAGDSTSVFGIRTVADGDSPEDAERHRTRSAGLAEFGVLCSTVSPFEATSRTTTVYAPHDATYRDIDRVLDVVERHARWNRGHTARPADVAPGFLTAVDLMMRSSAATARDANAVPRCSGSAYVYKDAIYDLIPRRVERIPELRTQSGVFRNLLRSEIAVRNRTTGWTNSFSMTYGTEGTLAGVLVSARHQPNWWFRVELELDEHVEVPPDPSGDASINQRIVSLCSPGVGK